MENFPQTPQTTIDETRGVEIPALDVQHKVEQAQAKNVSVWRKAFNKLGLFGAGTAVGAPTEAKAPEQIATVDAMDPSVLPGSEAPGVLAPGAKLQYGNGPVPEVPATDAGPEAVPNTPLYSEDSAFPDTSAEVFTIPSSSTDEVIVESGEYTNTAPIENPDELQSKAWSQFPELPDAPFVAESASTAPTSPDLYQEDLTKLPEDNPGFSTDSVTR